MTSAKLEHVHHVFLTTRVTRRDVIHCEAQGEDVGGNRRAHANKANRTTWTQKREKLGEINFFVRGDGDQDEIERLRRRRHFVVVGVHQKL